jgi:hypothetical protein
MSRDGRWFLIGIQTASTGGLGRPYGASASIQSEIEWPFSVVYQHVAAFRISGFLGTMGCIVEEQAG